MEAKYAAFRIDDHSIKNGKIEWGYFVRGQRTSDYNWPILAEFDSEDEAIDYVITIRDNPEQQPVYNPYGYEYRFI